MLDRLVGLSMIVAATFVFAYYTLWTLIMPFVDADHPLHAFFPPREWAIRIPVILILLGSAVVGSFVSSVMIRSNRKKAAKAAAASAKESAKDTETSSSSVGQSSGVSVGPGRVTGRE